VTVRPATVRSMSDNLSPWRILIAGALLLAACSPVPTSAPAPPPGPDLPKISAAAYEVVKVPFTEVPPGPVTPCELRHTEYVQVTAEKGRSLELKVPAQLSADNAKIFYAIYPAPENLLADLVGIAQACPARKVSQIVTPRQGKPYQCRNDVTTTATMDGTVLQVVTEVVPGPAPSGGEWTTNEQGRLVPPPNLGEPTCGTGVSYGQATLFAVRNGVAVQVVKPIDESEISEFDERPATLGVAAKTEAMTAMRDLLAALPS
jgi:hypothetical protein